MYIVVGVLICSGRVLQYSWNLQTSYILYVYLIYLLIILSLNCPITVMRGHTEPNLFMSSFVIYATVLAFICQDNTH